MVYLILDYARPGVGRMAQTAGSRRSRACAWGILKKVVKMFKIFKHLQKYIQLRQLEVKQQVFADEELQAQFVYVTVRASRKELRELPAEKVRRRIRNSVAVEQGVLLQAEPDLREYIPNEWKLCGEPEEVYISLVRRSIGAQLEKLGIEKKDARLLFLVGTSEEAVYVDALARGWNYVSVCAKDHEPLEQLYARLYEDEGLMVRAVLWDVRHRPDGDVAVDLTGSYQGLHRLYPEHAPVLDIYISHEKERILAAREGDREYVQILRNLGKLPGQEGRENALNSLTMGG